MSSGMKKQIMKCTSNFHEKKQRVRPYEARLFPADAPADSPQEFGVSISSDGPINLIPGQTYEVTIKEK